MNIYAGSLPSDMTEASLKAAFSEFGQVESAKIIMDNFSGRSKGFGFVEMPDNSEADKAIKAINKDGIKGCRVKVRAADPGGNRRLNRKKSKKRRF